MWRSSGILDEALAMNCPSYDNSSLLELEEGIKHKRLSF
jgi:hypothetical protein